METFYGKAHLPGTEKEHGIELEIDWSTKEVNVHIKGVVKGISDWPGLAVQTFGQVDDVAFHTKRTIQPFHSLVTLCAWH